MAEDTGGAIPKKVVQLSATVEPFVPRQNLQPPRENSSGGNGYFTGNAYYYYPVLALVGSPRWPTMPTSDINTGFEENQRYMRHNNVNNNNIPSGCYVAAGNSVIQQHEEMYSGSNKGGSSHMRSKNRNNVNSRPLGENFGAQNKEKHGVKCNDNKSNNVLNKTINSFPSSHSNNSKSDGRGPKGIKVASRLSNPVHFPVKEEFQSKFEDVGSWPALQNKQSANFKTSDAQIENVNCTTTSFASILKNVASSKDDGASQSSPPLDGPIVKATGARAKQPRVKKLSANAQNGQTVDGEKSKVADIVYKPEKKVVDEGVLKEKRTDSQDKTNNNEICCGVSNADAVLPNNGAKMKNKPKRKTEGQIKQERRMVIKALPSSQGNVGFISEKLRDLIIGSGDRVGDAPKQSVNSSGFISQDHFPVLGSRSRPKSATEKESGFQKRNFEPAAKNVTANDDSKYEADFPSLRVSSSKIVSTLLKCAEKTETDIAEELKLVLPRKNDSLPSTSGLNRPKSTALKPGGKKPKVTTLIQFDIAHMLAKSKTKQNRKAVAKYMFKNPIRKTRKSVSVVANRLDSSAPKLRRGKMREIPIKKKPSTFKKIILRERGIKKLQRLILQCKEMQLSECKDVAEGGAESQTESQAENGSNVNCEKPNVEVPVAAETVTLPEPAISPAKALIHTRRFREYCDHLLSPNIDKIVTTLVQDLIRFHDRLYHKDPIKAKMRRRLVLGFREVLKHLKLKKLKCIILAPNLEKIQSAGGVDDTANTIIQLANEQNLPLVFALGRKALGRICLKKVPVSCIGIFNYDGSETNYKKLMSLVTEARENYSKKLQDAEETVAKNAAEKQTIVPTILETKL